MDRNSKGNLLIMLELFRSHALTVIKVGGSLFDLDDLGARIERFLTQFEISHPVLVPGGGPVADSIRRLDRTFQLDNQLSHELGVRTLELTSRLLARLSPRLELLEHAHDARDIWARNQIPVIQPVGCVLQDSTLPASWNVTSDSIACWIATLHSGSQLILLKSTELPSGISVADAALAGLVDRHFPVLASEVSRISWCNLREGNPLLSHWK